MYKIYVYTEVNMLAVLHKSWSMQAEKSRCLGTVGKAATGPAIVNKA